MSYILSEKHAGVAAIYCNLACWRCSNRIRWDRVRLSDAMRLLLLDLTPASSVMVTGVLSVMSFNECRL